MEPFLGEELLGASPTTRIADMQRWYRKANAFADAWHATFGQEAPLNAVVLGLSVAQLETKCGDVWPGVHNWGAVQGRVPTLAEKKVLIDAGVPPSPKNIAAGQAALAAAVKAGTIPPNPTGSLQCDSSPKTGYYWVFFLAFPDDFAGARKFIKVLAENRSSCKQVLLSPAGSEQELAAAMYATRYYEGSHDPDKPGGKEANINQYASAIRSWSPIIRRALGKWSPDATVPEVASESIDILSFIGVQQALNRLGIVPQLVEDGVIGPKTRAAIKAFQKNAGLVVDGIAGPATCAALEAALKK